MSGYEFAFGSCFVCGKGFTFNPERVPSVFIDPLTKRPPDLDENDTPIEPDREALARARREPICPPCVAIVNLNRVAHGRPPIDVLPGAYFE